METVTHLETGRRFAVAPETARPSHGARVRFAVDGLATVRFDGFDAVACAGCGRLVAVASPSATVTVDGLAVAVAPLAVDRAVQDSPRFAVTGRVAYSRATAVATCAGCNGSPSTRARFVDELATAALARLVRFAVEL